MSERGVFALDRGWFDHPQFADEPFTEREAWAWLIAEAAWRTRKRRVGSIVVELKRGQLAASIRFLAERWKWSKSRVERFLKRLKTGTMIGTDTGTGVLVITLCNYDKYQRVSLPGGTECGTEDGTTAGQQRDKREDIEYIEDCAARPAREPDDDLKIQATSLELRKQFSRLLEELNIPLFPDSSRIVVWLKWGYAPSLIMSVLRDGYTKKRNVTSLSYFDNRLAEAHAQATGPPPQVIHVNGHQGKPHVQATVHDIARELHEQTLAREREMLTVIRNRTDDDDARLLSQG
jgi:hypothetical protein